MMQAETRQQGVCSNSQTLHRPNLRWCFHKHFPETRQSISLIENKQLTRKCPLQVCKAKPGTKYPELEKILDNKDEKGVEETMKVSFRKVDPFDLWIWFEHYKPLTKDDKDLLETILESWFCLGRMGGFNCMNLQVSENAAGDASFYRYDDQETFSASQAMMMDYSEVETNGRWSRFWLNMGTADEISLDVLINALSNFSRENLGIKEMIVGGVNEDWSVPNRAEIALEGINDPHAATASSDRLRSEPNIENP